MYFKPQTLLIALISLCAVSARGANLDNLLERSPFLPEGYKDRLQRNEPEREKKERPQSWALHGWITIGNDTKVSLYNKTEKRGYWMGINDPAAPIRVLRVDTNSRNVTVSIDGRTSVLELQESDLSAAPGARPQPKARPAGQPQPQIKPANNNSKGAAPTRVVPRRRAIIPRRTN